MTFAHHEAGPPRECPNGHRNTGNLFCHRLPNGEWECSRCAAEQGKRTRARRKAERQAGAAPVQRTPPIMRRGPRGGRR